MTGDGAVTGRAATLTAALAVVVAVAAGCESDPQLPEPQSAPSELVTGGLLTYVPDDERYRVSFPDGWEFIETFRAFRAWPRDADFPRMSVSEYPFAPGDSVREFLAGVVEDAPVEVRLEPIEVPGAVEALRISFEKPFEEEDGGLIQRAVMAKHPDGDGLLLTFEGLIDDPPDPALVEEVIASFRLSPAEPASTRTARSPPGRAAPRSDRAQPVTAAGGSRS